MRLSFVGVPKLNQIKEYYEDAFICIVLLNLQGCVLFGFTTTVPFPRVTETEYKNDKTYRKADIERKKGNKYKRTTRKGYEVWKYKEKDFCGVFLFFFPVGTTACSAKEKYYFKDDVLVKKVTKKTRHLGFLCSVVTPIPSTRGEWGICILEY